MKNRTEKPSGLGSKTSPAAAIRLRILHEDDVLIAVDKPAGLPTLPTADPTRPSLYAALRTHLARRTDQKPVVPRESEDAADARSPEPYLGIHQRLDADTTGVLLFAKHASANAGLAEQFESRAVAKTYVALTVRPRRLPPRRWVARDPVVIGRRRVQVARAGDAVSAETAFRIVRELPKALLVEACPHTGRKHQIRVHLAAAGLPILGDRLYAGPTGIAGLALRRVMLHAARLELRHPTTGVALRIEAPWPEDFAAAVRALSRSAGSGMQRATSRRRTAPPRCVPPRRS